MIGGYVDTNVVVRFLTGKPDDMAQAVRRLFGEAREGHIALRLQAITVAETVWVLTSFYQQNSEEVAEALADLVSAEGVECADRDVLLAALALYGTRSVDFADALLAARAQADVECHTVYTFDRHFRRLPGVISLDPRLGPDAR